MDELSDFLAIDMRLDVKSVALQQVLNLTGTAEGRHLIVDHQSIIKKVCLLLNDFQHSIGKDASLVLVNLSSDDDLTASLTDAKLGIAKLSCDMIMDPANKLADPACMILSNLTRTLRGSEKVFEIVAPSFQTLLDIFCNEKFNQHGAKLHYLAALLSNLSQLPEMRKYLLNPAKPHLQRLVSFTDYEHSIIRRGGVIGIIKNCCFQTEFHEHLLSESIDLLPKLLLPLAGPEEFDEEDNDKLPVDLQYLGADKTRERDPDLRKMFIETLTQLSCTKFGREYLRSKNTYVILRELHKWEKDENVMVALEHLVNIIIRFEHEMGYDNLKEVEVPEEIAVKFSNEEDAS